MIIFTITNNQLDTIFTTRFLFVRVKSRQSSHLGAR